jgi:hypothetical protein
MITPGLRVLIVRGREPCVVRPQSRMRHQTFASSTRIYQCGIASKSIRISRGRGDRLSRKSVFALIGSSRKSVLWRIVGGAKRYLRQHKPAYVPQAIRHDRAERSLAGGVLVPEYMYEHLFLMGLSARNPVTDRDDEVRGCM